VNHPGFNPQQLVNRGVFDSLEEADAVLCRLDEARSRATITPDSWRRGMAFDVPISAGGGFKLQSGSSTRSSLAPAPAGSFSRDRMVSGGSLLGSPESFPAAARGVGETLSTSPAPCLCPWCAIERAMNGQGAAPRTGFVAVERCSRHAGSSAPAVQSASMPHNSPAVAPALSHAAAAGFPINPNADVG